MSVRTARRIVFTLLALYTVSLTWPGVVPFNRIEPLVLGLPFVLFWTALWVVLVGVGFALLNAAETRAERNATSLQSTSSSGATRTNTPGPGAH